MNNAFTTGAGVAGGASAVGEVAEHLATGAWVPIPNCPGRYRLRAPRPDADPCGLLRRQVLVRVVTSPIARDRVALVKLEGGGLISYLRADGTYCHTLAEDAGWVRKLAHLGIAEP